MSSEGKSSKGIELKFVTTFELCPRNPGFKIYVDPTKSEGDYKKFIDEAIESFLHDIKKCRGSDIRNCLLEFYIQYSTRKNLRKYLFDKVNSVIVYNGNSLFSYIMDDVMGELFEEISSLKVFNVKQCLHILHFLSAYINNCETTLQFEQCIEKVALFYLCIMEVFTSQFYHTCENAHILQNDDCYAILDTALKHLLVALVKTSGSKSMQYNVDFVRFCYEILKHSYQLKYETTAKCALLMSHLLITLPDSEKEHFKHKHFPIVDFIQQDQDADFDVCLKGRKLQNIFCDDKLKVVLYSAIYNSVDTSSLFEIKIQETCLLEFLYKNLIHFGKEMTGFPEQIILITRVLSELGEHLQRLSNFDDIFRDGLDFSWAHLEHFVESVVHSSKIFLGKLLQTIKESHDTKSHLLDLLFDALRSMSMYSKVKLTALEVLCDKVDIKSILEKFEHLHSYLLTIVADGNMGILAGNIYIDLMSRHLNILGDEDEFIEMWIKPVMDIIKRPDLEDNIPVYQKIITYGFHLKPSIFGKLFPPKYIGNIVESTIILRCVHMARTKKITFIQPDCNEGEYWRNLILKKKLELYMIHQDEEVRLWALQVMVDSQKSTEEFTEWEILYLLSYFSYNVATQLPSIRKRIGSLYQKLFTRFQASYKVILRKLTNVQNLLKNKRDDNATTELKSLERTKKYYRGFLLQFIGLLHANLAPDANYSRKAISLELLLFLNNVATPTEWRKSFAHDEIINLKNILGDSYESNKALAVKILKTLPPNAIGFENEKSTRVYVERCLVFACDVKPSKSLTAAYMIQVALHSPYPFKLEHKEHAIYKDFRYFLLIVISENLEHMFKVSKEDVLKAAKNTPFHGLLLTARSLIQGRDIKQAKNEIYVYVFNKITNLCLSIKDHVMPIVCNASPEGHIPDSDDIVQSDESSKAQMVLVYAWKTMKEIMLILTELVTQAISLQQTHTMLSNELLNVIGDLFIKIFVQTKHRGVFEQAHVAFSTICEAYLKSKHKCISTLPIMWLKEAMLLCTGRKGDERLCATRRSAGLPFFVLSLVSTLADSNKIFFQRAMEELLDSSFNINEQHEEFRTHCLNILRFMFINSKLSDLVPAYVGTAVIASISGFSNKSWGVRNSATLLFSALITRMFGVQRTQDSLQLSPKNRMTLAVFYLRYPQLFGFLLKLLSEECRHVDSLMLHPVLIILARLYPSHNDKINDQVEKEIPCINMCIANPTFRTRDLAARASVSLSSVNFQAKRLSEAFDKISDVNIKDAECHGLLLQVWHLFRTNTFRQELPIADYLNKSLHLLDANIKRFSHMTVSLYMKVVSLLLIKFKSFNDLEIMKRILMSLSKQKTEIPLSTAKFSFSWNRFQLLMIIIINKFQHVDITYDILTREIIQYLYSDNKIMQMNCLYLLIYLNQAVSDDEYREHPLITAGEIEIPSHIKDLVNSFDSKCKRELLTCTHPYLRCFFYGEMKSLRTSHDTECFTLIFLLLRFYPCIFSSLHVVKEQAVLDFLLDRCGENAELTSAIISCVNTFISTLAKTDCRNLCYAHLIKVLMRSSSPAAPDFLRLTVAQFLVTSQFLFKSTNTLRDLDKYNIFNIVIVLLEDEELIVRNTMSSYPAKERVGTNLNKSLWIFIPDKTRSDLMLTAVASLPNEIAVCFLVSWAIRHLPEVSSDKSEVYDRGELNIFAENIPVSYSACKVLNGLLWPLGESLTYEDKSIFLEEQTLLVTTVILNSLIKIPSPMVDKRTKTTTICALKCIVKFIEEASVGNEFHKNFKVFFSNKILKYLRATLTTDYSSVKYFLSYLYGSVLKSNAKK